MKTRSIYISTVLVVLASAAIASVNPWPWMSPAPELKFQTKGEKLIAYLPRITINNSPAIVETSTFVDEKKKVISLNFVIIQNRDLYRRSTRRVAPEWQLGKIKQEDYTFGIKGACVALTTEQLTKLQPPKVANK